LWQDHIGQHDAQAGQINISPVAKHRKGPLARCRKIIKCQHESHSVRSQAHRDSITTCSWMVTHLSSKLYAADRFVLQ
jgi:hypothetical protein